MRFLIFSIILCAIAVSQVTTFDVEEEITSTAQNLIRSIEQSHRVTKEIVSLEISKQVRNIVKVAFVYGENKITPEVSCGFKYDMIKAKVVSHTLNCKAL